MADKKTATETPVTGLPLLRVPFPPHQISTLPKGGVKLSYVGHAALTDRLLDVDPTWNWEPLALDARGLPVLDEHGGLWIRLTVCGMTRLGYGDAGQKKGGDAMKERIGDALRNAAMRFGAALDLWHKGELHAEEKEPEAAPEGYLEWKHDMTAVADEGLKAYAVAWKDSRREFTAYALNHDTAWHEANKVKAQQAVAA